MFTGIIESLGLIEQIRAENDNIVFTLSCPFVHQLRPDQSLAHNGVCLTVTEVEGENYHVTAIQETLQKTNLGNLRVGDRLNLERCMKLSDRLDGHIVQGHVDCTGRIKHIEDKGGSWIYSISVDNQSSLLVDKGSVCVNGVSLTVVSCDDKSFHVAIIPYTYEHTTFHLLKVDDLVNIEFDIIGKYVRKMVAR